MNSSRKQQLNSLLIEVLKNLIFKRHSSSEQLQEGDYRSFLLQFINSYSVAFVRQLFDFVPHITDTKIRNLFLQFLHEELNEFIEKGRIQSATIGLSGGNSGGYPLDDVMNRIICHALIRGSRSATESFVNCLTTRSGHFQELSLLTGVAVDQPIQVFDGISLIPIPASFAASIDDASPLFLHGINRFSIRDRALLRVDYCVSPVFCKPGLVLENQDSDLTSTVFKVTLRSGDLSIFDKELFCHSLSITKQTLIVPVLEWKHYDTETGLFLPGGSPGGLLSFSSRQRVLPYGPFSSTSKLRESDMNDVRDLYHDRTRIRGNLGASLDISIDRWITSLARTNQVDALIDLGVALESIYLGDIGSELSYRFTLRAAWFLGEHKADRRRLLREFKDIYNARSRAVHTGAVPQEIRLGDRKVPAHEFIDRTRELCLRSILKILQHQTLPDWDDLTLG